MDFKNRFKSRKDILKEKVNEELKSNTPNIKVILEAVDDYESNNLKSIEKYKKKKKITTNKINGALKQTILAHGSINNVLIGSATKRIHGALLESEEEESAKFSVRDIMIGLVLGTIIYHGVILLIF